MEVLLQELAEKKTEEDRSNGRFIKIDSNGKILWTKQDFSGNRVLSVTQISSGDYIIGTTSSVTKHNSLGNKLSEISIGKKVNAVIATKDEDLQLEQIVLLNSITPNVKISGKKK